MFCPRCGAIVDDALPPVAPHEPASGAGGSRALVLFVVAFCVAAPLGAVVARMMELNMIVGAVIGAICGAVGVVLAAPKVD